MKKALPVFVLLVAAGLIYLFTHLGGTLKTLVETAGSQALRTSVTLGSADVSLSDKKASLNGLAIANPKGYDGSALTAKTISVALQAINGKTAVIEEILIDGATVTYAIGPGGSNLQELQKNIRPASAKSASGSGEGGGYKLAIKRIRIVNAQLAPASGRAAQKVTLPEIVLKNIGSEKNPASPAIVASMVMSRILAVSSGAALHAGLGTDAGAKLLEKAKTAPQGVLKGLMGE